MGSSSKPTTQSLPCTSLSFSLPVWPLPSLRLFPSRLMLEVFSMALDTPVPLLLDTLLPQLPMPLPQLPLLSQLPMLLPSQLPPRSLSPSLPLLSPETTPLDLPAFTTPVPAAAAPIPAAGLGLPEAATYGLPPVRQVAKAPIVENFIEPVEQWGYKVAY